MSDDRITITIRDNGPLVVAGDDMARVRLVDHTGAEVSTAGRKAISLCRCGASSKKPFCDGTHSKIGFQGAEAARAIYDAAQQQGAAQPAAPPPVAPQQAAAPQATPAGSAPLPPAPGTAAG
jgi:CDGSH-type Zn-finger protein